MTALFVASFEGRGLVRAPPPCEGLESVGKGRFVNDADLPQALSCRAQGVAAIGAYWGR